MNWETVCTVYLDDPDRPYVLVSLVGKKGSSYLQPGARMLVRDDGSHWGGISAGCLEDTIAGAAVECLVNGQNRILEIDTRPFFGCFGQITVLLEVLPPGASTRGLFQQIKAVINSRSSMDVVTDYRDLSMDVVTDYRDLSVTGMTRAGQGDHAENRLVERITPKPRLLVFGDWPDGQAVVRIARVMGWDVLAFDPSQQGFNIGRVLSGIKPDQLTAAVVMSHNFARDAICLQSLLRLPLGYVGLIGSRKRREEMSNELADGGDMGLIEALDRLHCPAGLDLGGDGHEAIALSVVAEVQSVLMRHNAAPLREKSEPVHRQTGE